MSVVGLDVVRWVVAATPVVDSDLNYVHYMNMVQSSDRRERIWTTRREAFLDATRDLIGEHGIEALTIKAVADRVDCAVGTLYTYFASKGALVAALQAEAITQLGAAYSRAVDALEGDLVRLGLGVEEAALARLVAFGRSTIAAARVLPDQYRLQQRLLTTQSGYDDTDMAFVVPVAFEVLARPERLLREAAVLNVIEQGDAFDRTVAWVAAINGVLMLASLQGRGVEAAFDPAGLADMVHLDLLRGWGADPLTLATADHAVPISRIAALLEGSV